MRKIKQILAFAHNGLRYVKSGKRKLKRVFLTGWIELLYYKLKGRKVYRWKVNGKMGWCIELEESEVLPFINRYK